MIDPADLTDKSRSWQIFERIAPTYDRINTIISLGWHHHWRKALVESLPIAIDLRALDIATGTGDVAFEIARHTSTNARICGVDLSSHMLELARQKAQLKAPDHRIVFHRADAAKLPFSDCSFDVVTCAFGMRNMPRPGTVLDDIRRVLRPGGRLLVLETSMPRTPLMRHIFSLYFHAFVPLAGRMISKDKNAYKYLQKTVEQFYSADEFIVLLEQHSFRDITSRKLFPGVIAVFTAEK